MPVSTELGGLRLNEVDEERVTLDVQNPRRKDTITVGFPENAQFRINATSHIENNLIVVMRYQGVQLGIQ
jgi:hypothetical protein